MHSPWRFFGLFTLMLLLALPCLGATTRFVVVGDSRGADNGINSAILQELVTAILAEDVELVIFPGDLTNDGTLTQLNYWVQTFMEPLEAQGIAVYPCRGNHDVGGGAWNTVFSGAKALPADGPVGETNLTYSVTHNDVLFLLLDAYSAPSIQVNLPWLNAKLAANVQPHVFLISHVPAFPVQHVEVLGGTTQNRDALWDAFGAANGRVYFTGHDHFYDHAVVPDSAGNPLHQVVAGTGGAPLYSWTGPYTDPRMQAVAHYTNYGYLLGEINGATVQLTFKERSAANVYTARDTFEYQAEWTLPLPAFTLDVSRGYSPLTVRFTDATLPGLTPTTSWLWNFGDGETSTAQNPEHIYEQGGIYTVALTVANSYGSRTFSLPSAVGVDVPAISHGVAWLTIALLAALGLARLSLRVRNA